MQGFINALIFLGTALMVYNIVRYSIFIKQRLELERDNKGTGLMVVPLVLLIFFLIGYAVVGLSGFANLIIAAILFGGSVFVFLLLSLMYSIIHSIQDTDKVLSVRFDEMKAEVNALTQDALSTFCINLTQDVIEERGGRALYETDAACNSFTELIASRGQYMIDRGYAHNVSEPFTRDGLLRRYMDGQTSLSEVLLVRLQNGSVSFVQWETLLTKKPVSGDVIAFMVERAYNEEVIRRFLQETVLMDQYDRIAYLIDGSYREIISNDGKKKGLLLGEEEAEDNYESLYFNTILPAMVQGKNKSRNNPLRLSTIDKALTDEDVYHVYASFEIEGEVRRKHFVFYCVDRKAKFYLMLLTDAAGNAPQHEAEEAEEDEPSLAFPLPEEAQEAEEAETEIAPERTERFLLVDDNEINREIMGMILESEGYAYDTAVNGQEAVERVEEAQAGTYAAVLMDVQMPVLNGYEATGKIRALADPEKAGVVIVALTAASDAEDRRIAQEAGMDGFLTKPIQPDELRSVLNELAEKKEG